MASIALTNSDLVAIVDDEDIEKLKSYRWRLLINKRRRIPSYIVSTSSRHAVSMHRIIMDAKHGQQIDHADGNALNNQKSNLRFATASQQMMNRPRFRTKTSSRYKGVYWDKTLRRWQIRIAVNGKEKTVGYGSSENDAARKYNDAAMLYHGEFARLNEIQGEESCL